MGLIGVVTKDVKLKLNYGKIKEDSTSFWKDDDSAEEMSSFSDEEDVQLEKGADKIWDMILQYIKLIGDFIYSAPKLSYLVDYQGYLSKAKGVDSVKKFYNLLFVEANIGKMTFQDQVNLIDNEHMKMHEV